MMILHFEKRMILYCSRLSKLKVNCSNGWILISRSSKYISYSYGIGKLFKIMFYWFNSLKIQLLIYYSSLVCLQHWECCVWLWWMKIRVTQTIKSWVGAWIELGKFQNVSSNECVLYKLSNLPFVFNERSYLHVMSCICWL